MTTIFDTSAGGLASFGIAGAAAIFGGGNNTYRSIGGIVAPCTLQERHTDTLSLTNHPVELGAQITDHAFKNPVELDITIGWGAGSITSLPQIYQQLLDLQRSAVPFDIVTGKRQYKNMIIVSIGQTTGVDTENSLIIYLSCREVIIVETQITSMKPAANQANPQNTSGVQNLGTVQTTPAASTPGGTFSKIQSVN
jgi:hypothetical protein